MHRLIFKVNYSTSIKQSDNKLKWVAIVERWTFYNCKTMHSLLQGEAPVYLKFAYDQEIYTHTEQETQCKPVKWCHLSTHRLAKQKPFPIVLLFFGTCWIGFEALFQGSHLLLHIGESEISRWFGEGKIQYMVVREYLEVVPRALLSSCFQGAKALWEPLFWNNISCRSDVFIYFVVCIHVYVCNFVVLSAGPPSTRLFYSLTELIINK